MLGVLALMLAQGPFAEEPLSPLKTPKILFQEAERASGFSLCKGTHQRRQAHAFRKRYGERVRRLAAAIEAKEGLGWDGTEEFILTCRMSANAKAAKGYRTRTLNEFEPRLKALEDRYLANRE